MGAENVTLFGAHDFNSGGVAYPAAATGLRNTASTPKGLRYGDVMAQIA
jgi:hypothetical protein